MVAMLLGCLSVFIVVAKILCTIRNFKVNYKTIEEIEQRIWCLCTVCTVHPRMSILVQARPYVAPVWRL